MTRVGFEPTSAKHIELAVQQSKGDRSQSHSLGQARSSCRRDVIMITTLHILPTQKVI